MSSHFYNTINLSSDVLKSENAKALLQEVLILEIFKANPTAKFSPSQIHYIFDRKYHLYPPITSIRRGITNLTGRNELIKTGEMIPGTYHLPENTWKLAGTTENIYQKETKTASDFANKIIQSTLFD